MMSLFVIMTCHFKLQWAYFFLRPPQCFANLSWILPLIHIISAWYNWNVVHRCWYAHCMFYFSNGISYQVALVCRLHPRRGQTSLRSCPSFPRCWLTLLCLMKAGKTDKCVHIQHRYPFSPGKVTSLSPWCCFAPWAYCVSPVVF